MLALIIAPLKLISPLSLPSTPLTTLLFDQSMTNQHICPCCSYVLLRHIQRGELYWRCSHCYESMPAWSLL